MRSHSRKSGLKVVSLESIHLQTLRLNFVICTSTEYVDGFVGELTREKPLLKCVFCDEITATWRSSTIQGPVTLLTYRLTGVPRS